jgi:geranylgeranyl diphosphate synthase, type II
VINSIETYLSEKRKMIEDQLGAFIARLNSPQRLQASMAYSLKAGGKRLRPILLLAVIEALGSDSEKGMAPACSLEMLHTYSLIHDDLPAMDDDDLRRGKPTNHIQFGEATAILAGDGLLTYSFECLSTSELLDPVLKVKLITELAKAAGPEGMVGGQISDLEAEGKVIALRDLESIHRRKTGRLLSYAVKAGALIGGATEDQLKALEKYADHLGVAFQIKDDILDIEGDQETIGKPIGSDLEREKSTYPSLLTLDGAKEAMETHYIQALQMLKQAELDASYLEAITRYTIERMT